MSVAVDQIWTVTPAASWTESIRDDLDVRLGLELDYVATADGAWTAQAGQLAFEVEQRVQAALAGALTASASRARLLAQARDRGLTPREATPSTMVVALTAGTGGILPVGTELRLVTGTVLYLDNERGGITVPLVGAVWTVVENEHVGELVEDEDEVVIECSQVGQVTLDGAVTFRPVAPITGISELTGDALQTTGRDGESMPELRQRIMLGTAPGGSPRGLVGAIRDLAWVVAVGLVETPGYVRVTVAPAPPTSAHEENLAEVIYARRAMGAIPLGDNEVSIEGADGAPFVVRYDVGATQSVTVAFTLVVDATITLTDARRVVRAALDALFATLTPGATLYYLAAFSALNQPGVRGGTLTLDGGVVDVTPSTAATTLIASYA